MDAHDPEYLAAAGGMADLYGGPARGDQVWFSQPGAAAGEIQTGRVVDFRDEFLLIETAEEIVEISRSQMRNL